MGLFWWIMCPWALPERQSSTQKVCLFMCTSCINLSSFWLLCWLVKNFHWCLPVWTHILSKPICPAVRTHILSQPTWAYLQFQSKVEISTLHLLRLCSALTSVFCPCVDTKLATPMLKTLVSSLVLLTRIFCIFQKSVFELSASFFVLVSCPSRKTTFMH